MALSGATKRAAIKYGPSVNAIAHRYRNPVTGKPLSGAALLAKLVQGESGDDPGAVSNAGARGRTQFMPASRQEAIRKYGVDPLKDTDSALHAAALHLRGKINGSTGLEGYNPGGGQGYVDYILGQKVGGLGASLGSSRAPGGSPSGGPSTGLPGDTTGAPSSALVSLLASGQLKPQAPVSAPQAPSFSAQSTLPKGYQSVQGATPALAGQSNLSKTLAEIAQSVDTSVPKMPSTGSGGSQRSSDGQVVQGPGGAGSYPLSRRAKLIGTPHSGTHTLGNWQSDNAVDLGVPAGTPIRALEDGVIRKVVNRPSGGGRFAGGQITLAGHRNAYFYGHTSRINVQPGQRVKKGQIIGRTGSANGVPHLHLGIEHGDPRRFIGQGR